MPAPTVPKFLIFSRARTDSISTARSKLGEIAPNRIKIGREIALKSRLRRRAFKMKITSRGDPESKLLQPVWRNFSLSGLMTSCRHFKSFSAGGSELRKHLIKCPLLERIAAGMR